MFAKSFHEAIKKVKNFAWEDGPSHIYKNVLIQCDEHYIHFFCSDGRSGIWQRIKNEGIVGECCADVFALYKIFEKIDDQEEINIKITNNCLKIFNKRLDVPFKIMNTDQIITISKGKDYINLDKRFLHELQCVLPGFDDENPIVYNGRQLFYANPRALIYLPTNKLPKDLCIEQKFIAKIFLDDFDEIAMLDGLTYFRNNDCEIFLPTFNGKMLKIDPIVKLVNSEYTTTCKVSVKELSDVYNLANGLFLTDVKIFDQKIIMNLSIDSFEFQYCECKFRIFDYLYNSDYNYSFNIPINHLKMITRKPFTRGKDYIYIKLAKPVNMFACANDELLFVGGLYRV